MKPTFRETAVHSQLASESGQQDGRFIFARVRNISNGKHLIKEFSSKFFLLRDNRHWSLLPGSILNWNQKSSLHNTGSYQTLPTIERQLLSSLSSENNSDEIEGLRNTANDCLQKSLSNIFKLNADIVLMESEINKLKNQQETNDNYPMSPLIGRQRSQRTANVEMSDVSEKFRRPSSSQEY